MKNISLKFIALYTAILTYTILVSIVFVDKLSKYYTLIINPIVWFLLFILSFIYLRNYDIRVRRKKEKLQTILIVVLGYIIIYYFSGLVFGYSRSPYSHSLIGILKNMIAFLSIIIFQEYTRNLLIVKARKNKFLYFLITVLFILIEINFYDFKSNFISGESGFKYISEIIIPTIGRNLLFLYLSLNIGKYAVITFRLPLMFTKIITPIFPDLDWFMIALFELTLSFICFVEIYHLMQKNDLNIKRKKSKKNSPIRNIPFILTLFIFVFFVAGMFKYMPVAVMSNSMANIINRGDLVIVEKLNDKEKKGLKLNDVVEYQLGDSIIIHRIIKIEKQKDGTLKYMTKGDNNSRPDNKYVHSDQIKAKVKLKVPVIGYPIVYLNEFFQNTVPDVELGK